MKTQIGILTSGGDCPGLNAAIRGIARAGLGKYNMQFIGFRDGFRGLVHDRTIRLDAEMLSGILADGGTILSTSRDKPHRMTIGGKTFSIVAVAEGAMSVTQAQIVGNLARAKEEAGEKAERKAISADLDEFHAHHVNHTVELTEQLESLTSLESRLTILGHLQQGGSPSAIDRVLATLLGAGCAELMSRGQSGLMVAVRGGGVEAVPLEQVAGRKKFVPTDHPWLTAARRVGTCFGGTL